MAQRPAQYRVVVLGGGPAGCAVALALARRGVDRVLLAEAGDGDRLCIGESIPPDTRPLLESLGLWETFLDQQHEPCLGSCSAWGDDALGYNDFIRHPLGHGWHLDRRRFDAMLSGAVRDNGVTVRGGLRFAGIDSILDSGYRLRLTGGDGRTEKVDAYFVIDATGQRAAFARRVGARRHKLDRLGCVYGFFSVPDASLFTRLTLLEAVDYGWWYAARLPECRLAVAVAADPATIKRWRLDKVTVWRRQLNATRHLGERLDRCPLIGNTLYPVPAHSHRLEPAAGRRWLAVGDAASAFDPIAAQGIYKALWDGLRASKVVDGYLHGDTTELARYQRQIAERFEEYCTNRQYFYNLERRWPRAGFWKRRSEDISLQATGR